MNVKKVLPDRLPDYPVMTRRGVRDFDAWAINEMGIPGVVLMENAGCGCAEVILRKLDDMCERKVCILCGTGNNGGDGYVIARHLENHGIKTHTVICGDSERVKGDALVNLRIICNMNLSIEQLDPSAGDMLNRVRKVTSGCHLIVDAIFGTGLTGELRSEYAQLIAVVNACNVPILAVDIPSGLDCDTGLPLPVSIEAKYTVTFVALKTGYATCPQSRIATGQIYIASIGVEPPANTP